MDFRYGAGKDYNGPMLFGKPIFQRTAAYGHFGREPEADGGFSWERTDLADKLKAYFA